MSLRKFYLYILRLVHKAAIITSLYTVLIIAASPPRESSLHTFARSYYYCSCSRIRIRIRIVHIFLHHLSTLRTQQSRVQIITRPHTNIIQIFIHLHKCFLHSSLASQSANYNWPYSIFRYFFTLPFHASRKRQGRIPYASEVPRPLEPRDRASRRTVWRCERCMHTHVRFICETRRWNRSICVLVDAPWGRPLGRPRGASFFWKNRVRVLCPRKKSAIPIQLLTGDRGGGGVPYTIQL